VKAQKNKKMEEFSYVNIFETKGIEYLAIIAFLILLIPFWILLNRQIKINKRIRKTLGVLTANVLRIPQGLFYCKNHTWTYLEKTGAAKVGLDDLLLHITGEVKLINFKKPGEMISKGELLAILNQEEKALRIYAPISGQILSENPVISQNPEMLNEDPYGEGWIYKIKPSNWKTEINSCLFAEDATNWLKMELDRFKDFLVISVKKYSPDPSVTILQDGGELRDNSLSDLPAEIWQDFQRSFLPSPFEK